MENLSYRIMVDYDCFDGEAIIELCEYDGCVTDNEQLAGQYADELERMLQSNVDSSYKVYQPMEGILQVELNDKPLELNDYKKINIKKLIKQHLGWTYLNSTKLLNELHYVVEVKLNCTKQKSKGDLCSLYRFKEEDYKDAWNYYRSVCDKLEYRSEKEKSAGDIDYVERTNPCSDFVYDATLITRYKNGKAQSYDMVCFYEQDAR